MIRHFKTKIFLLLFLNNLTAVLFSKLKAQQNTTKEMYYVGMEMGPALLQFSSNQITGDRLARYELNFYGGYVPFRALRLGVNLNGYLMESFGNINSNPEKGISISNIHGQLQVLPFKTNNIFTNIQGGWSNYTNHHPDGFNSKGISGKLGFGYYFVLGKKIFISLMLNYGVGKFNDVNYPGVSITNQRYNAYEIVIGITYRQFKIKKN